MTRHNANLHDGLDAIRQRLASTCNCDGGGKCQRCNDLDADVERLLAIAEEARPYARLWPELELAAALNALDQDT